jgi:hypothetical protein
VNTLRVVVAGALANKPGYGGEAWVRLAWVHGLAALGADVMFVEELAPSADRVRGETFFRAVDSRWGLGTRSALITADGQAVTGAAPEVAADFANGADLLVNISGNLRWAPVFEAVRRRVYVDLDPGFTQFWHAMGVAIPGLERHDLHFTVGESIGTASCTVPTGRIRWLPVRQPVMLEQWPAVAIPDDPRFTTVASWRGGFGAIEFGGRRYGLKAHEFRRFIGLPQTLPLPAEIALDIHPADNADRERLVDNGWRLVDPAVVAGSPEAFRDYVSGSAAELSVAQGVYVDTRCGWFSDRSARYLAAGRPVIVQDTGFGRQLPVGEGLFAFRTPDEAVAAAREVAHDLAAHGRAARRIASEYFDARVVLSEFLERALEGHANARHATSRPSANTNRIERARTAARPAIVSGMVAAVPGRGGATWAVLQYVLGLQHLGRDVHLVEEIAPEALMPAGSSLERSANARYFAAVARAFGLERHATLLLSGTEETVGLSYGELMRLCDRAGVLVNLSGALTDPELMHRPPVRLYVDLDPAFTHLWASDGVEMRFGGHTHFATVGLEVGTSRCAVPSCGIDWLRTLPPVVLSEWCLVTDPPRRDWTTVAHWRGYGSIQRDGVSYGQKAHSFRPLFSLPPRTGDRFQVALDIHPAEQPDIVALRANGWQLVDPVDVAGDPLRYRRFVQESAAEVGIAKSGYVVSRSGWFSDRSACYLASGRPVLAQDTGFGNHLPTGLGLLAFRDLDDAADAVAAVRADYGAHARAARRIAEEYLDSDRVLPKLLREVES